MSLNKMKCEVRHLGWGNSLYQHRLGHEMIESSPEGKNLGVLLEMSQQGALTAQKANYIPGSIKSSETSRAREKILSLCSGDM